MTFLNKTNFAKKDLNLNIDKQKEETASNTVPKLGGIKKSPLKTNGLGKPAVNSKPGSLLKKKAEPKELDLESSQTQETAEEIKKPINSTKKPVLGKKLLGAKKEVENKEEVQEIKEEIKETIEEVDKVDEPIHFEKPQQKEVIEQVEEETVPTEVEETEVEEVEEAPKKTTTKKKAASKKATTKAVKKETATEVQIPQVDETKRVSLDEMDAIMRPIVAPTTELWEQEKKDILEALNAIKVEQDMNMSQVKTCLSDLDELKFEILPRQHDAETMYDGTKQNYDTVKAVAIAKGSGSNAEARKAEGILACQNFVTPSGAVVDLHQYMLLIEERYKFYEKISEGVNFKKYSLVNYNNAIKAEKEGK